MQEFFYFYGMEENNHTPKWRRRKDERSDEILDAALELFVSQGFSSTKMGQLAQKAGVTPGTIYLYYDNKESILQAVVEKSIFPVLEFANEVLATFKGSAVDLFEQLILGWWEKFGSSKFSGVIKLVMIESSNFPELAKYYMENVLTPTRDIFRRVLQRGIDEGVFKVDDMDYAVRTIMAPLQYMTIYSHSLLPFENDEVDFEVYTKSIHQTLLKGIIKA